MNNKDGKFLISVVIPVKNNPVGIALLLESLKKQTLPNNPFEIIVVDNGSTDHTAKVVKQLKAKLFSCTKPGSYAARNLGVKKAKGKYIAFTDSDCIATHNWLAQGLRDIKQNSSGILAGKISFLFQDGTPNVCEYLDSANKLNQKSYARSGFSATANMFIKKSTLLKHGLFREDLLSGGDYEFGQRVTLAGKKLTYSAGAMVLHSARHSAKQIFRKTIRVAKGYKKLKELKLLKHHQLAVFSWLPVIRLPRSRHYKHLGCKQKILLFLLANTQKYLSLIIRTF